MIAWSTVNQSLTPISLPTYWARSPGRSSSSIFFLCLVSPPPFSTASERLQDRGLAPRLQRMRYTKTALLMFGAGLVLALVVVGAELDGLERVASTVMALGIAAVPVGMAVDWRLATRGARRPSNRRGQTRP